MRIGKLGSNLIAFALGGPVGVGLYNAYKGIKSNRDKNRQYIEDNFSLASERLQRNQGLSRQNTSEGLVARGLSPVHAAMGAKGPPTTVGAQLQADNEHEFGLERKDLNLQRDQAIRENKIDFANNLIRGGLGVAKLAGAVMTGNPAAGASGVGDIAGASSSSQLPSSVRTINSSPIHTAMGVPNPLVGYGGVHVTDPLGDPSSSWYAGKKTLDGSGLLNSQFNTGLG